MSRKIIINKYQGNTVYSVSVFDSYGTEHHLGYYSDEFKSPYDLCLAEIEDKAEEIWKNEAKPKEDLLGKAIAECIQSDIDRGVEPNLD